MHKKLVLISNVLDHYETNTLVHFKNVLPINFLSSHLPWSICVESISFHAIFKNHGLPKDEHFPSLLQITQEELRLSGIEIGETNQISLDVFQNNHRVYLESSETYTPKQLDIFIKFKLMTHYKTNTSTYAGFPCKLRNGVIE